MENKKEDFQRGIYKLATLLLVAFISQSAFAQKQTITGRIIDINNEAIIGASILEKGTTNGTITDFDGKFSLEVSSKSTLIISYIGYKSKHSDKYIFYTLRFDCSFAAANTIKPQLL